ncbi:MAG: DNA translocase FtsK 4TM domain-containing protein, partial [Candidatus Omnitrophica bacterium]|nr:DNA translocase FtsK 4TM domain-containing protein [Candidatus Omnitrophota bacterium]
MKPSKIHGLKAFALAALAIFLLLSLISYHPDDTPFRSFPANAPVKNLTGIVGAYIAEGLFISIGQASYIICFLLLIWAAARLLEKPAPKFYIKLLGTIVLLLSSAVLLTLFGLKEQGVKFQRAGLAGIAAAG